MAEANKLRLSYDKQADVLYMAFGQPKEGIDQEVTAGVFVRVDEDTQQAIGMTIVDFEKRFSQPMGESVPIDFTEILAAASAK